MNKRLERLGFIIVFPFMVAFLFVGFLFLLIGCIVIDPFTWVWNEKTYCMNLLEKVDL